jgi:hypothetical protein
MIGKDYNKKSEFKDLQARQKGEIYRLKEKMKR